MEETKIDIEIVELTPEQQETFEDRLKRLEEEGKVKVEEHAIELERIIEKINTPIESTRAPEEIIKRNQIIRIRSIALKHLGLHPLMHTIDMSDSQKSLMNTECRKIIDTMTEQEIYEKFNEIVCNDIFTPKADYSKFAIYQY